MVELKKIRTYSGENVLKSFTKIHIIPNNFKKCAIIIDVNTSSPPPIIYSKRD